MSFLKRFFDKELTYVGEGERKLTVFGLALPIFLENISVHLVAMLSTMISSHYYDGAFIVTNSAVNQIVSFPLSVVGMVTTGGSIILSIYLGKKREDACKRIIGTAFTLYAVCIVAALAVVFIFAEPLLRLQLGDAKFFEFYEPLSTTWGEYGIHYMRRRCVLVSVECSLYSVIAMSIRCYGHTKVSLIVNLVVNVVAVLYSYIMLYKVNVPAPHAIDVFISSNVITGTIAFSLYFFFMKKHKIPFEFCFDREWIKRIIVIGAPAAVSGIMYNLSQTVTAAFIVRISDTAVLARTYVSSVIFFVYQIGWAIGQANSIMMGRVCGAGDLDKGDRMHRQNLRIALLCNITVSVLIAVFGKILMLMFTSDESVLTIADYILWIDVFVEIGRGMNHLGQFGLNATGDTVYTTVVSIVSAWAISVGLAYLFGIVFGMGIYGFWIAFAMDELFRGILYYIRWRRGGWRKSFYREEDKMGAK